MNIKEISLRKFNVYCYSRSAHIGYFFEEMEWFEAFNYKLIATIVIDRDSEYSFLILGRDKRKIFRAIDFASSTFRTKEEAKLALRKSLLKYENDGLTIYEQGDERKMPNEFLKLQVPKEKLHPYFKVLTEQRGHEGARNLINEIIYSFIDVDGNYIKDFQTTGFDSRLWELYLYIYLYNARFSFDNSFNAPDYLVSYFGNEFAIEAVTVNHSDSFDEPSPKDSKEAFLLSRDYMPIKFGSSLTTKLKKQYWLKDHVKGKPFIIAIHDFHKASTLESLGSMTWSRNALIDYLYGIRPKYSLAEDGKIVLELKQTEYGVSLNYEKIEKHEWKNKRIESGFFGLPEAENVSAILFSNNATLTTFNRMGQMAGLGLSDTRMIRFMDIYNPDPGSVEPIRKVMDIMDKDYEEAWGDGLVMYHNPNAKCAVDINSFPDISHMFYDAEKTLVSGYSIPYEVLNSMTIVMISKPQE
ncbi:hypothetical protein [Chitinophaga ginsengisoli]|uniref:Glycosaminoglycan attachment protein n=1 Tax=Chitinophaga ginsengisoli TaxID=363837 RepID=A0A2P8FQT9_9BACT|nr:hypothetical protein [Chitinophaga ginsengisoli]PSL24079.1 hypothetical protein CLV42_11665 [Chitinophaga ginsengisoli]